MSASLLLKRKRKKKNWSKFDKRRIISGPSGSSSTLPDGTDGDLLTDDNLKLILKADKTVKSHKLYDRWCAKWRSSKSGNERCMAPMSLSSFFFPTFPDGEAFFNGEARLSHATNA